MATTELTQIEWERRQLAASTARDQLFRAVARQPELLALWEAWRESLKRDHAHMPMSPTELQQARRVLRGILTCIDSAKARHPRSLRSVEPDGR